MPGAESTHRPLTEVWRNYMDRRHTPFDASDETSLVHTGVDDDHLSSVEPVDSDTADIVSDPAAAAILRTLLEVERANDQV